MNRAIMPLLLLTAVLAGGCELGTTRSAAGQMPAVSDLRSRVSLDDSADPVDIGQTTRTRVNRLDLPRAADLSEAWKIIERHGVEPAMGPQWRENGLCVGLIHVNMLKAFLDQLPGTGHIERRQMLTSNLPTPIDLTPPISRTVYIEVIHAGDQRERVRLDRGVCRLLLQSQPQSDGSVMLSLTPQHFFPQESVRPRTPMEKQLDGRIFQSLELQCVMSREQVLVIGLATPATPPYDVEALEPSEAQDRQDLPGAYPLAPESGVPIPSPSNEVKPLEPLDFRPLEAGEGAAPLPRLGSLVLEAGQWGKPTQMVLFIVIEPTN